MRSVLLLTLLVVLCQFQGTALASERAKILKAARPAAAKLAGQPVRLRVDRLNETEDWAVLVGSKVGAPGKKINWEIAEGCREDLDKMLWVVLRRNGTGWRVKHIEICASEPPYWYLEQYEGFAWPCAVYAGLTGADGANLEQECVAQNKPSVHRR